MAPPILNVKLDASLLATYLRRVGISAPQIVARMAGDLAVSRKTLDNFVLKRGKSVDSVHPMTVYAICLALNEILRERGERPLTAAGLRHLASIAPSLPREAVQDAEIRRAQSMR